MTRWVGTGGLLVAAILLCGAAQARTIKIAYVDVEKLISESDRVRSVIEPLRTKYQAEIEAINQKQEEIGEQAQDLRQRRDSSGADAMEIERLREDLQKSEMSLAVEMREKSMALRKEREDQIRPLIMEVESQIQKIGREEGYDFIFRKVDVPFINEKYDITDAIIRRIDAQYKPAATGGGQ